MHIEKIDLSPEDAFVRLRGLPRPFIFSGGGMEGRAQKSFSYVSAAPFVTIKTEGGRTVVADSGRQEVFSDPFEALSKTLERFKSAESAFPFNSGAFGYFSYDLKGMIEPRVLTDRRDPGAPAVPELMVGLYDPLFVYDRADSTGYLVSVSGDEVRLKRFRDLLKAEMDFSPEIPKAASGVSSNMTKQEYLGMINSAQRYISSGDIYQINLSQRLEIRWEGDPFALFLSLNKNHPAPFSSYLDLGDFQIISNSPERLLKVCRRSVETSPIKGTRPRGSTMEKDLALIKELKASAKERAEHVMIVDLERNDLGRISVAGSVEVVDFEKVETYRHLHHMISTVRGTLNPGVDSTSALKAVFPGGSITGAPKIRAMEIIDELEPSARGVYTGGIGWMSLNGDTDIAMAIRTAVYMDGCVYLHVGGGIVADSVPEEEYKETLLKAEDFLSSLGISAGPVCGP
ncbi:MAG: aminodeoxychorismate synthase component I [Deltaproteobacteria bacterium]|nr:aminodeoxychorismate synthase component I [Deltaproteobacteria bacterium]